jgi:hypothetical protein
LLERGSKLCTQNDREDWLADITHWPDERRIRVGYDGSRYDAASSRWTQSSFIQPQMMVHDRYFYDPLAGKYTVDRYLDDLENRYGGIDAILIWPTYPNLGIDNRNQQDMHATRRRSRETRRQHRAGSCPIPGKQGLGADVADVRALGSTPFAGRCLGKLFGQS